MKRTLHVAWFPAVILTAAIAHGGEQTPPIESAPAAPASPATDSRKTALVARMVVKVVHPDEVRQKLTEEVRRIGGYPALVTDDRLVLKIPPSKLDGLMASAAAEGIALEKAIERKDLTVEVANLRGQLASRLEILERLRGYFTDSNVAATLRIEQSMTGLVREIEAIKGQLRVAEDRTRWAILDLSFRFQQPDRIIYIESPFEWLNSVDLQQFIEEF